MNVNPYAPPTTNAETPGTQRRGGATRLRRGPALYIVGAGLIGGLAAIPFLARQNPIGVLVIAIACAAGGIAYRVRSRNWPRDPTIRSRQFFYSVLALIFQPASMLLVFGQIVSGPSVIMIGLAVGGSVAGGIFLSGSRRLNALPDSAGSTDSPATRQQDPDR